MWKTVAMAVVAILVPILVLLLLGTKEQEKIPVSYRIVEDDKAIDSSINPYMLGKDLVIEYKSSVKPRVEGSVNYTVLDDRVIIYNYSNQHFRLIFGYSSDVYEFGETTALLGEFVEERKIEIELQDYIDRYLNWTFTEIDSAHWYANFTFNTTVYNDIKACYSKKCTDNCWASIQANYFPEYNVSKVCNDIKNITNYPYQNLTEGVKIDKIKIDTNTGTGSFYLTFPYGFRRGERAKFGFNSTIISTATTTPWNNQRVLCEDGAGIVHLVWSYNSTVIMYANNTNGVWRTKILNSSSDAKSTPSIDCSGNNLIIGWAYANNFAILTSANNGGSFTFVAVPALRVTSTYPIAVARKGSRCYFVASVPGSDGARDLVFYYSATCGSSYSNITIEDAYYQSGYLSENYQYPDIIVNGTGTTSDYILVAAQYSEAYEGVYDMDICNSTTGGTSWSCPSAFAVTAAARPSITYNQSNYHQQYMTYTTGTGGGIYFTKGVDNSAWTTPVMISQAYGFYYGQPQITTDSSGNPAIFWSESTAVCSDSTQNIIYSYYTGTAWSKPAYMVFDLTDNRQPAVKQWWKNNKMDVAWYNGTSTTKNINYNSLTSYLQGDTTPPTVTYVWSSVPNNTAVNVNTAINISARWSDNSYLCKYLNSSKINNTGSWVNGTWVAFAAGNLSNYTITFPSSTGSNISVRIYGEDISKNQNATGIWFWWNVTPSAAQVYERNLSISFTQGFSTARSVNMQRELSQYVYLPVQFGRYATIGRTSDISISTITEFLRNTLYTRDFSTSTSIVAELLRNAGYTRETSTSISTITEFFRTASYGRSISTGISALVEFFKLIKPLDYCFEIRRDGNTVTCVKDKVSQVNCLDITDINNWIYICELADRMLMVIKL